MVYYKTSFFVLVVTYLAHASIDSQIDNDVLLSESQTQQIIFDPDYDQNRFTFKPPEPCNDYPDQCHLPIDYFFFLGAHNAGAYNLRDPDHVHTNFMRQQEFKCGYNNQDQNVTTMMRDGIRLVDVDLCGWKDNHLYLCHSTHGLPQILTDGYGVKFSEFVIDIMNFLRENPYQIVIIHLSDNLSNTPTYRVNSEQIENVLKEIGAVEFIYTRQDTTELWPSMANLVNYNQNENELKLKSRIIVTNSGDFKIPNDSYQTSLISDMFWQSTYFPNQKLKDIKPHLHQACHGPGGIGYEAIEGFYFPHCIKSLTTEVYNPIFLNDTIFNEYGCHYEATPLQSRLNVIMVDFYRMHWKYLKELQNIILNINHVKWTRRIREFDDHHRYRYDEL